MSPHDNPGCPDLRRAFDLLRSCHRALFASLNEKDLLQAICDAIVANGRYIGARIDLVADSLSCEDRPEGSAGTGSDFLEEGAFAWLEDDRCDGEACSPNLALPLREEGRLIGTLSLYAGSPETLADGEMDLLQEVADEIAFGIGYMRLIERWQRLAAVVEAAPEAIGFTDAADPPRCTYLNPAGRALVGEHSGGEPGGLFDAHPQWAQWRLREEVFPRAMAEGTWRGESAVLGDGGEEIPVEQTVIAHRDASGRVKQFSTLMRDIWDRKRAEEALRREALHAESMTQALFDALPGMVFLLDEDGQLLRWNHELERLARLPARELPGVGPAKLFPSEPTGRFEDVFRQALEEESAAAEIRLVTNEGLVTHLFRSLRITIDGLPLVLSIAMDIQDCKAAEERSRLAATVFEAVHDGLVITDPQGRIAEVNPAFSKQTGYTPEEARGVDPGHLLDSQEHPPEFFQNVFAEVAEQGFWEGTVRNRRKDGTTGLCHETIAEVRDEHGKRTHYVASMTDVTPIKEAERRARREAELTDAVVDSLPGVFFFLDHHGYNLRCNRRGAELAGTESLGPGRPVRAASFFDSADRATVREHIRRGFQDWEAQSLEADLVSLSGERTPVLFTAMPVQVGETSYLCGLGIDITRRKEMEAKLRLLASTDPLTGACNRNTLEANLNESLAQAERYATPFSLGLLDLDNFKELNDRHGHQTGDQVLVQLVTLLEEHTREADTVCRWGGEEFMVLMPQTQLEEARAWAERFQAELRDHTWGGLPPISVSIGLTEFQPGDLGEQLLGRADAALYAAKRAGRNRVRSSGRPEGNDQRPSGS